jgi:hypothetical protein
MAISHKARYYNGFPNFYSNTDVLAPSFYSMLVLSLLSVPTVSGHKIGHILLRSEGGALSPNGVGFSRANAASDSRVRRGKNMVINQKVDGPPVYISLRDGTLPRGSGRRQSEFIFLIGA